jgi:predicted acyltransferase (DUF342 family)
LQTTGTALTVWPFIIFTILFAAFVVAHFLMAYQAWRASRKEQASDIDQSYVRLEDYFARSFRLKVSEWLTLTTDTASPDGTRTIKKGTERIQISNALEYPPKTRSDDILVVRNSFKCLAGCYFGREIYVSGDASIGAGSQLQAIAADGNLCLSSHVQVARWIDSLGNMDVGAYSIVHARATAGGVIHLAKAVQVKSVFAPTIRTYNSGSKSSSKLPSHSPETADLPSLGPAEFKAGWKSDFGIEAKRLSMLSSDCWFYNGNFKPSTALHIKTKLIISGSCTIPAGSILDKDIKSKKSITIGAGSICRGNVIAEENMLFEDSSCFYGIIHAARKLRLCRGVRGGDEGMKVAAFSMETLTVDENITVHGKLASEDHIVVSG